MTPRRSQQGYSLVEVLVAFVILAMALTVLFRIFSSGLRNVDVSADYSRAVLVAEERLTAPGRGEDLQAGVSEGVVADRYRWTRNISEYRVEGYDPVRDSGVAAFRIEVEVLWESGRSDRRVALSTIRLDRPRSQGGTPR